VSGKIGNGKCPFVSSPSSLAAFKSAKKRRSGRKANRHSGLAAPRGVAQGWRTRGAPEDPLRAPPPVLPGFVRERI